MPYTIICFIWRKSGTSPSEFKNHYEKNHIPLVLSVLSDVFPLTHSRFYLPRTTSESSSSDKSNANYTPTTIVGTPDDFTYDVISKLVFEDAAACDAFLARNMEPAVVAKIVVDEERFIERKLLKVVTVDEPCVTVRPASK